MITTSSKVHLAKLALVLLASFGLTMCKTHDRRDSNPKPPTDKPDGNDEGDDQVVGDPENNKPVEGFTTGDDGTKIHYLVMGRGTPILLIHGYYADAESNWFRNGIAAALAKTNKVIALDNRGHGKSDKPHDSASYGQHMWQDSIKVLEALKVQKAHVHGYSMGGSIVTQLLYHKPELFITATFGGSGIWEVDPVEKANTPADAKGADPEEADAKAVLMTTLTHDVIAMAAVAKNAPWSGPEEAQIDLETIKIPVLALNGEFDSPLGKTHRMERELADFKSVVFKGKSHLTTITPGYIPDLYLDTLIEFVTSHNP